MTAGAPTPAPEPAPLASDEAPPMVAGTLRGPPLFWPTLFIFGTLLWAYVVLGELVVSLGLPELVAFLVLVALSVGAWRRVAPPWSGPRARIRRAMPLILAIMLWFSTMLVAVTLAGPGERHGAAMTIALWFLSALVFGLGSAKTVRVPQAPSKGGRAAGIGLWVLSSLASVVAMVSAFSRL